MCVYPHTHSLNQILCCKTFTNNRECKNEYTTWYYWIQACTMLKTTAHQRILFLDKIIHFISSHIIPIIDISIDNNIALKTHSLTSDPCNTPTPPNITQFIFHTVTFGHTANAAMLMTLHSHVTLPYTLKHSYHWEILQIKVKDNKVNSPDDADIDSLWNNDYDLQCHMANLPKKLHCVQHPWKLEGGGEDKDTRKFLISLLAFIADNMEKLDIHNNIKAQDINMISICWMLTSLNIRKWE